MAAQFKLVILGDHGVGKTSFLKRHSEGTFLLDHHITENPYETNLTFNIKTSILNGNLVANCWDGVSSHFHLMNTQAYIIMFDLTSYSSFEKIEKIYEDLMEFSNGKPIILVGNKCDENQVVKQEEIKKIVKKYHTVYCPVSVKTCFNIEKPFLYLLKKVTSFDNLSIILDESE